jgi:PAS domain S-box-containing protein
MAGCRSELMNRDSILAKRLRGAEVEPARTLDAVFDAMLEPVILSDGEGRPVRANRAMVDLLGQDPAGMSLNDYAKLLKERNPRRLDSSALPLEDFPFQRALRGEEVCGQIFRLTNPKGSEITIEANAKPIFAQNRMKASVAVWRDITKRWQAEEALRVAHNELEAKVEERTARLRKLTATLVQTERRERRRLAQVLHDSLQHQLVAARYSLETLRDKSGEKVFEKTLLRIDGLLATSLETTRTLTTELCPPILYEAGLAGALKWLARWFGETHGLKVRIVADDEDLRETEELRTTVFHGVRELLFNVVKHAKVNNAQVQMKHPREGVVRIGVIDKGRGFDSETMKSKEGEARGLGLFNLRERIESLGGNLVCESAPGRGTRVTLIVPLSHYPQTQAR